MKRLLVLMVGMVIVAGAVMASEADSPQGLKSMALVHKAVAFYKQNGLEATIKAVNDTKGPFRDGEYYIFIHSFEGINLARGDGNLKRLGSNVLEDQDSNGKFFVQEMIKTARRDGSGWVDYLFKNPLTGRIQTKHSYIEKIDNAIIGCGFFN